jgi:hypothetical protein
MNESRDSSVDIAIGYGPDGRGSIPCMGKRIFSNLQYSDRLQYSHSRLSNGYRGVISVGVKRLGHEDDHSPPFNAEL